MTSGPVSPDRAGYWHAARRRGSGGGAWTAWAGARADKEKDLLTSKASREKEWTADAAGRLSLAGEIGRVNAELQRLRAVLREHGIEPGNGAA
ncbi:MAG TPA: hypothetical protein VGQ26_25225 [Streptosporangiaceae bacterium]|jgi:hypothetical protein|nr:hypothetical protein [Streptosporangiaceae bacterium]